MNPLFTKGLLVLVAAVCFVAAYFMPDQRVVLVAAGVGALGFAAPELGKLGGGGKSSSVCLLLAGAIGLSQPACTPAVTSAVVQGAAAIVQEVLLRSQQSSVVLDQVEGTLDQLQVPADHKARTAVQACRAALGVAVKAVRAGEQTAEAADVAFQGFREQWAVLMRELQALGLSSADGRMSARPGSVAIDEPLALEPFGAQ